MSGDSELDVVVFGATGFVGRLVAGYLARHAPGEVRIGLAGRSERRLAEVRAGLGAAASAWPLLVADSADPVSLAALARAARVVVTTVGPYRARGLALVQACAEAGTDYADLTGEVLFIRDSIDRCHDVAAGTGARIVHCCGFDSVPSDLGVLLLHQAARADDAGDLLDTTLAVTALRGGISGGTLASMTGQLEEVRASAQRRRVAGDPYALSPDRAAEPGLGDERDLAWARYDGDLRMWTGPWLMAGINTRVVRRSNALQGWAYGRRFRYREVTGFGASPAAPALAAAASAAAKAAEAGLAFGPSRALLSRLLPAPGQGPGEKTRRTGYFRIQIAHPDLGRAPVPGHHRGPGRPGIRCHLGDARRNRIVPRAGQGPAARPRRRPDTGHRDGRRAHRPAQVGGPHAGHPADHSVTRQTPTSWPVSLYGCALRTRRGCRNEIKKALTSTSRDQAHTRPMAAPGQRQKRAFAPTAALHKYTAAPPSCAQAADEIVGDASVLSHPTRGISREARHPPCRLTEMRHPHH